MIKQMKEYYQKLHPLSHLSVKLGIALMLLFYIVGFVSRLSAPYVPNYFNAIYLFRGCMEAAPACLAAGVCAALLGDMMMSGGKDKRE